MGGDAHRYLVRDSHPDQTLHLERRGTAGPLLVALHGLPTDPGLMWSVLPEGTRRINVHLPGYGQSAPVTGAYDFGAVEDALVAQLPDEPLVLVGFSGGAFRALRIALRDDVQIERLVLLGPAFGCLSEEDRAGMRGFAAALRAGVDLTDAVRDRFMTPEEQRLPEAPSVLAWLAATAPTNLASELDAYAALDPVLPLMHTIEAPILMLVGDQDRATPMEPVHEAARTSINATLHVLSGVGHAAPVFHAQETRAVIEAFLP